MGNICCDSEIVYNEPPDMPKSFYGGNSSLSKNNSGLDLSRLSEETSNFNPDENYPIQHYPDLQKYKKMKETDDANDTEPTNLPKICQLAQKNLYKIYGKFNFKKYEKKNQEKYTISLGLYQNNSGNLFYEGEWHKGKMHGKGKLFFSDGRYYEGFLKNGKINGRGVLRLANGDIFDGEFYKGVAKGPGTLIKKNGTKIMGCWENDYLEGFVTEILPDGGEFKGEYMRGVKHGKGCLRYSSGDVLEANFVNGVLEGEGFFKSAISGIEFRGYFYKGQKRGKGMFRLKDGRRFEGMYIDDLRNGEGRLILNEKESLTGNWLNGKKNGRFLYNKQDFNGQKIQIEIYYQMDEIQKSFNEDLDPLHLSRFNF